jgi:hypothetical protein
MVSRGNTAGGDATRVGFAWTVVPADRHGNAIRRPGGAFRQVEEMRT